jgi:CDP-glucose 4,6-dehydratase
MTSQLSPREAFWRGRRVLLTGHTGFKGAWALAWLHRMGALVTGLSLPPNTNPALYDLIRGDQLCASIIGDLRDGAAVEAAVKASAPELVLHMAAQPIVRRAIADPIESIATNVLGTAHLLQALRGCASVKAVLVVTSDKVYANDESGRAFLEDDRLGGKDPYSASKAAAELVTSSFARSYFDALGVPVATARCGNIVGGGDYSQDRIVPDVIRAAQSGQALTLRHPEATRPWLHVIDGVAGYLLYLEALSAGASLPRALNFGPFEDEGLPVQDVVRLMQETLNCPAGWRHEPVAGSIEMRALAVGSALARETLDWRDRILGPERIRWTGRWHHDVAAGADPRLRLYADLDAYMATGGAH